MKHLSNHKRKIIKHKESGFTLLEVLIAMVIFGTTVAFLVRNITDQQRAHADIGIKNVAHWVAMNKMAETRMEDNWPDTGVTRGDMEMREHKWYWLRTVSKTSEKNLRQIEIEVRLEESDELPATRFIGFMANKNAIVDKDSRLNINGNANKNNRGRGGGNNRGGRGKKQ